VSVDPFAGFNLETRIAERASVLGLRIETDAIDAIASHARAVLQHNERLQLTTVTAAEEFLERHIGESLEGAALLDSNAQGCLLDLGSGNGYPAIPLAATRRGLDPVCVEASAAKAAFLNETLAASLGNGRVWNKQVQRPNDFEDAISIRVLTSRAMGNWERIFPRIAPTLAPNGIAMLWAGESVKQIATRDSWRRLSLVARHTLPGRQRSWIWCFRPSAAR
jgi:16S rRNA (guanine527-N7)-methyltransferase